MFLNYKYDYIIIKICKYVYYYSKILFLRNLIYLIIKKNIIDYNYINNNIYINLNILFKKIKVY